MENENITPQDNNEFKKEQFDAVIKEALQQAKKIGELYRKYFESKEENKLSIFDDIESRLKSVIAKYNELFGPQQDGGASKINQVTTQIDEIKNYHQELLKKEDSIQADIEESQEKITKFYIHLFGSTDAPGGAEEKLKKAIEDILAFQHNLNGTEETVGFKKSIEDAHEAITALHSDIFVAPTNKEKSKADILQSQITSIKTYHGILEEEIKPFITDTHKQIATDRKSIKALLASAIGPSLLDGFLESKREYKQTPKYYEIEKEDGWYILSKVLGNITAWLWSRFVALLNYAFFLVPLLLSVIVVLGVPDKFSDAEILGISFKFVSNFFSSSSEKGIGLFVVLPLWWIAWFGHRNLSQNKRMAEEYNHKAQVTRMYIKFTSDDESSKYPLSDKHREKLYNELIEVIARHPGKVFGRDETLLDKVLHIVAAWKGVNLDQEDEDSKKTKSDNASEVAKKKGV